MGRSLAVLAVVVLGACASRATAPAPDAAEPRRRLTMELGAFSVSLAVKDLAASRSFYEKLGFAAVGGDPAQNWLILRNGTTTIGLFQGMFERNLLTFNPGWSAEAKPLPSFVDIREIQRELRSRGLEPVPAADESSDGPAHLMLTDPDGNPVLLDQHVPRPAR